MTASASPDSAPAPAPNGRAKRIGILAALGCALAVLAAWWWGLGTESTDDAHVQAEITLIAPRIAGTVVHVAVQDNQAVQAGDLLFELKPHGSHTHSHHNHHHASVRAQSQSRKGSTSSFRGTLGKPSLPRTPSCKSWIVFCLAA